MGNLFTEEGPVLVAIRTKDVMVAAVVNSVQTVPKLERSYSKTLPRSDSLREANLFQIL